MKVVTVIPLKKGIFKEDLTYFTAKDIPAGNVVKIPLRGKTALGLVVSSEDAGLLKASLKGALFNLKKIIEDLGPSFWASEFIESALDASKYFASSRTAVVSAAVPAVFKEHYETLAKMKKNPRPETGEKIQSEIRPEKLLFQTSLEDRIAYYKNLVRGSFVKKKSVFMVLPSEKEIESFFEELSRGINKFTFALYSGMGPKKLLATCEKILSAGHPVLVLCTPQFLSLPVSSIGTIIVERENSSAYHTISRPYLDFRIFAEILADKLSARFVLGDKILRFESIAKADQAGWSEVRPLSFRTNFSGNILVSAKGERRERKEFKIFSEECAEDIREVVQSGKNAFVFSLRKGLATYTVCRDCGETLLCDKCSAPVVLYTSKSGDKRMFACNRCRRELNTETACPNCGSWDLMPLGIGTDTVYRELKELFSDEKKSPRIFKLDKESVKTARQAEKLIKDFEDSKGSIMVGTELALFYLRKPVPLSVIASLDSLWSVPSFRMSEKIVHILTSILDKTTEKLCIETKNPDAPEIKAVERDNLAQFVRGELEERQTLGYPPFRRFIKVTFAGNKDKTTEAKKNMEESFIGYQPEIFSGFVPKVRDKYITNALIKLRPESWILPELSPNGTLDEGLLSRLLALPPDYSVHVDPEDLL